MWKRNKLTDGNQFAENLTLRFHAKWEKMCQHNKHWRRYYFLIPRKKKCHKQIKYAISGLPSLNALQNNFFVSKIWKWQFFAIFFFRENVKLVTLHLLSSKMLYTKNYTLIKAHCNLIGIIISFTHCREEEYFIMYIVLDKY